MKNKQMIALIVILLVVGFASVSTVLYINGTLDFGSNEDDFGVIFTEALVDGKKSDKAIISDDKKKISFSSNKLTLLNESSILEYKVKNVSTQYDANVTINCTTLASEYTNYIKIDSNFAGNDLPLKEEVNLEAGEVKSGYIKGTLIQATTLDNASVNVTCEIVASATERDNLKNEDDTNTPSFANDSWETISTSVKLDDYVYEVGDTKCVALDGLTTTNDNGCENGEFLVRVANTTKCTTEESETACGFVVEFVDVIAMYNMNVTLSNVGGWTDRMRPFLNDYVYNSFPSDLQSALSNTKVVAGHGSEESANFITNDKVYLLSYKEIYGENEELSKDTSSDSTRQLDYYKSLNVSLDPGLVKKRYNGSFTSWWLRSANSMGNARFLSIDKFGEKAISSANNPNGVSCAFRIG